jgi:hypothetical protein
VTYTLRAPPREPDEPCRHCGHELPGWHRHGKCPGLQEGRPTGSSCMVVHFVSDRGYRRCGGARGYDVTVSVGVAGLRHHHARPDSSGIYCRDCATRIAFQCNVSFKEEKSA